MLFVKADWCPHCRAMKPEMEKVARDLAPAAIPVYAVDSEKHREFVQKLKIRGFPTILFVDASGQMSTFEDNERNDQRITSWVCVVSGRCSRRRR